MILGELCGTSTLGATPLPGFLFGEFVPGCDFVLCVLVRIEVVGGRSVSIILFSDRVSRTSQKKLLFCNDRVRTAQRHWIRLLRTNTQSAAYKRWNGKRALVRELA